MSCDYLPKKLNILLSKFPIRFKKASETKFVILLNFLIIVAIAISNKYTPILIGVILVLVILSFGRDDFVELFREHKNSRIQYNMYCLSMYFTLIVAIIFLVNAVF